MLAEKCAETYESFIEDCDFSDDVHDAVFGILGDESRYKKEMLPIYLVAYATLSLLLEKAEAEGCLEDPREISVSFNEVLNTIHSHGTTVYEEGQRKKMWSHLWNAVKGMSSYGWIYGGLDLSGTMYVYARGTDERKRSKQKRDRIRLYKGLRDSGVSVGEFCRQRFTSLIGR